ncbi:helix-turn-helix domain-containing protein [Micromonospora matsumotoense]|uniref:helix-turn-helix domain-containing protein n=1 Tax=Micromonospora matsumotoense TaxID=121616 RepID=UPI003435C902
MTNVRVTQPAMDGRSSSGLRLPGLISQQQVAEARRDIGRRLAAWRAEQGLTQMQLASSICYSRSSVANAEIGPDTSVPDLIISLGSVSTVRGEVQGRSLPPGCARRPTSRRRVVRRGSRRLC